MTPSDWKVVRFFLQIRDQYENQQPMGEPVITVRLEAVEAGLRLFVPESDWCWIVAPTMTLFGLVRGSDTVNWWLEFRCPAELVPLEKFYGGDAG